MTTVKFIYCNNLMQGFTVKGHSTINENDELGRLVCTAISSATYLTCNTLTDVLFLKCDIKENDGFLSCKVLENLDTAQITLKGFKLHMEGLKEQYKSHLNLMEEK